MALTDRGASTPSKPRRGQRRALARREHGPSAPALVVDVLLEQRVQVLGADHARRVGRGGVAIAAVASAGVSRSLWRWLQPLVLGTSCAIRRSGVEVSENRSRAVRDVQIGAIYRAPG